MGEPLTILIVDDHPIFRSGIRQLIEIEDGLRLVGEASSGAEAIALATRLEPDIVLLDLSMEDSGLDTILAIRQACPNTKVAILTASDAADDISTAIDHGINAYILKGATGSELLQAIYDAHHGELHVSPRAMAKLVIAHQAQHRPTEVSVLSTLSRQEVRVLQLVAQGNSNRQVGEQLNIQEKTVKFHLSSIYAKLGVRNRVEATLVSQGFQKTHR